MKIRNFMFKNKTGVEGFTLIELLVAVAIIGLLSSVVLSSLNSARTKSKISSAKLQMNQVRTAMNLFLDKNGKLPLVGSNVCSACSNPCTNAWTSVVDSLVNGGHLSSRIDQDPWGNYYCYDDNYKVPNCSYDTPLWSMGPNGARDTSWGNGPPINFSGDDFGIIIERPQC